MTAGHASPPRRVGQCYVRGPPEKGRTDRPDVTKRQILRMQQKEAETQIQSMVDQWFDSIAPHPSPGGAQTQRVMLSAYDCAEDFTPNIPVRRPPAEKYDYSKYDDGAAGNSALFSSSDADQGVVERMLRDTVVELKQRYVQPTPPPQRPSTARSARESLKQDIHLIRPEKIGPSKQASIDIQKRLSMSESSSKSGVLRHAQMDVSFDTTDGEGGVRFDDDAGGSRRGRKSFQVPLKRGRSFGFEKRNPKEAARNAKLRRAESEFWRERRRAEFLDRHVTHLALREEALAKLRAKTRQHFEEALLRSEPHALAKLDAYLLNQWELEAGRVHGRRCHPSRTTPEFGFTLTSSEDSAASFLDWLRASAKNAITKDELPPQHVPRAHRGSRMRSARVSEGHVVHPSMPRQPRGSRRDEDGVLLSAERLKPPRPDKLMSDVSKRLTDNQPRELVLRRVLAPGWDLTPQEMLNELDGFEQRLEQDYKEIRP